MFRVSPYNLMNILNVLRFFFYEDQPSRTNTDSEEILGIEKDDVFSTFQTAEEEIKWLKK